MLKKIFTPYAVFGCILAAGFHFMIVGLNRLPNLPLSNFLLIPIVLGIPFLAGWVWAGKTSLPDSLFARLAPLLLPPLLLALSSIPHALDGNIAPMNTRLMWLFTGILWCCFYVAFLIRSEWRRGSSEKIRGAAWLFGIALLCVWGVKTAHHIGSRDVLMQRAFGDDAASVGHGVDIWRYLPFNEDNELVRPAFPPSLLIASDYPRLDGAIAVFPLYAAFAQAVYDGLDEESAVEIVDNTNTAKAYKRLVDGEVDIFFGVSPSQEQLDYAASKGLTLTKTPIGKEAFVFFVHKDNPAHSLTQAEIRAIYSGRIRNWKELGGPDVRILAFQRPENSGSQSTILQIMDGEALARPLREEINEGMGDIVIGVAAYRNSENAVGYSFRWYVTALFSSPDIRLLAIDGVEPTVENIRSGAYPFTVPMLAVTARPLSAESKSLLDWITGPEGQDLLERVGYVPLR